MIKEGTKVLITDLDEEALKKVSEEIKSTELYYIAADVTDEKQVKVYAEKAKELFGFVDVFFNNAGIEGEVKPLDEDPLTILLASDESSFITGTVNPIDGGMTALDN